MILSPSFHRGGKHDVWRERKSIPCFSLVPRTWYFRRRLSVTLRDLISGLISTTISSRVSVSRRREHQPVPALPTTGFFITPSHPTVSNFSNRRDSMIEENNGGDNVPTTLALTSLSFTASAGMVSPTCEGLLRSRTSTSICLRSIARQQIPRISRQSNSSMRHGVPSTH